jgi:putative ABC transport system permease protein
MVMLNKLRLRLRALFFKPKMEDELQAELQFHLEREIEENIIRGMSPEEARYAALRSFGGVERVKEESRDARGVHLLEEAWQDVRYGARMLAKNPGFTLVAILTLALGIGANTAIFSLVNAVLIRPLPFAEPERLVWTWGEFSGGNRASTSPPDFLDYRAQNRSFEELAATYFNSFNLTGAGEPERIIGSMVTTNFFQALGVKPVRGRAFLPEEEQSGRERVAIIGQGLWQRRFGGDPQIIGKTIQLDGRSHTVVGVAPDATRALQEAEIWTPLTFENSEMKVRRFHFLRAIGRLKQGVTLQQAQADIDAVSVGLEKLYPESNKDWRLRLVPMREYLVGQTRRPLYVLLGAVGFVLLIACANVANLTLAQASRRQKEVGLRHALGANRMRLIRQMLTESALLSVIAGAVGLLLAWLLSDLLRALAQDSIPRVGEIALDTRVLGFTLLVSLLIGVVFGLAPALQASRPDLNETLKEGGKGGGSGSRGARARDALIVVEVAMALVLLVGAGLLIKSFRRLQEIDPGFDPRNLLTMRLFLPQSKYAEPQQRQAFFEQALKRIESLPGVQAVGTSTWIPTLGGGDTYFTIEGMPFSDPNRKVTAFNPMVSHDYLRAMKIPLVKGRHFTEPETKEEKAKTVIINEAFARAYFADVEPLGKRLIVDMGEPWTCEIVGVVGDTTQFALNISALPAMYLPSIRAGVAAVVVRASGDPLALTASVREAVREVDKDQPIASVRSMDQIISGMAGETRFRTLLMGVFAAVALLLSAIGIYGVIAYSVAQRTREMGIRMALGAQGRSVLGLVIGQGMKLTLIGVGVGIAGALALTRALSSLLFNVSATDPLTFVGVSALLGLAALLACYVPARRATKVDPLVALRCE